MAQDIFPVSGFVEVEPGTTIRGRVYVKHHRSGRFPGPRGVIRGSDGHAAWLPGHSRLTACLEQLPDGALASMTYLGKQPQDTPYGKKDVHMWKVLSLTPEEVAGLLKGPEAESFKVAGLLPAGKPEGGAATHEAEGAEEIPF